MTHIKSVLGLILSLLTSYPLSATYAATTSRPTTNPAELTTQLMRELNADAFELASVLPPGSSSDPNDSKQAWPKIASIARDAVATIDRMPPNCQGQSMASMKVDWLPLLIVVEDKQTIDQLKKQATGTSEEAVLARISFDAADLMRANHDQARSEAAARRIFEEAEKFPASNSAASALLGVSVNDQLSPPIRAKARQLLQTSPSEIGEVIRFQQMPATTQSAR